MEVDSLFISFLFDNRQRNHFTDATFQIYEFMRSLTEVEIIDSRRPIQDEPGETAELSLG